MELRLDAIAAADRLLGTWSEKGSWGETKSSGRFPDTEKLTWRWTVTSPPELRRLSAESESLDAGRQLPWTARHW